MSRAPDGGEFSEFLMRLTELLYQLTTSVNESIFALNDPEIAADVRKNAAQLQSTIDELAVAHGQLLAMGEFLYPETILTDDDSY